MRRRSIIASAALLPFFGWAGNLPAVKTRASNIAANDGQLDSLMLSDFAAAEPRVIAGGGWRGFSDQVMGGVSSATLAVDTVAGRNSARLVGTVTRESNGGFIQMALYFGSNEAELDGSAYSGLELLVCGNNEDYNVHIRTSDCGWYDESYRATFFATSDWQRLRIPFSDFRPNGVKAPLDAGRINRIAILGWMREFEADIALGKLSLYV